MIRKAKPTASAVATAGSNRCESTGSPSAPIPSEVSVTPSCIAAMNLGGESVIRSTARAVRWPSASSSWIRVRRAVTNPYSAATKKPFSRTSTATARSSRNMVTSTPRRADV